MLQGTGRNMHCWEMLASRLHKGNYGTLYTNTTVLIVMVQVWSIQKVKEYMQLKNAHVMPS